MKEENRILNVLDQVDEKYIVEAAPRKTGAKEKQLAKVGRSCCLSMPCACWCDCSQK